MRVSQRGPACQGRGVPAASPVGAGGVAGTVVGRLRGVTHACSVPQTGLLLGATGQMTAA